MTSEKSASLVKSSLPYYIHRPSIHQVSLIAILIFVATFSVRAAGQDSDLSACGISERDAVGFAGDLSTDINAARKYEQAAAQLLEGQKFGQLDCLADHLRSSKERFAGGNWKLHTLYQGLENPGLFPLHATAVDWDKRMERLQQWVSARPKSVTARVAMAQAYVDYAWDARGSGYSDTVSGSGWKLFEERTAKAKELLDQAATLPTRCPEWYVAMLRVARGQAWSAADMRALFQKAYELEPEYYYSGRILEVSLLPKWVGEPGEAEEFVQQVADHLGGEKGDLLYFQMVPNMICSCEDNPQLSWPRIVKGFEASEKLYGTSMLNLNTIAHLASIYGERDPVVANKALARIGDQWDEQTWGERKDFEATKEWARAAAPSVAKQQTMESAAESNLSTPEGRRYQAAFEKKYREFVGQCIRSEGGSFGKFETLTKVGANGGVYEMRIYWNGPAAICVYQKLRTLQEKKATPFPRPPQAPYWVRLDLDAADFIPGGLAASFEDAAAQGDSQEKDASTKSYFSKTLLPYYAETYGGVLRACFTNVPKPSNDEFSFVAAIDASGHVAHLYRKHETNIFQCMRDTLQSEEFPHPPVAPYYLHIDMKFADQSKPASAMQSAR